MIMFADRADAGERLATRLVHLRDEDPVVLGLPRGGVPVAFAVAEALDAPLDVIVVRKLGVPYQPELGMGAVGEDGVEVINHHVVRMADVSSEELAVVERRERAVVEERAHRLRGGRPRIPLTGRTAIIVDDGIATGSTMRAACQVARAQGAKRVVVAVPVAPSNARTLFRDDADDMICLETPHPFYAVGQWYSDFTQTSDDEVRVLLSGARQPVMQSASDDPPGDQPADPPIRDEDVIVSTEAARLAGHLTVPDHALGLVLFAHGSGSGRHSPRNRYVADVLNQAGLGTLLFDLLTPAEEIDRANVFDIALLAGRLVDVTRWLAAEPGHEHLPIGYFGASTGAAAALMAAADADAKVAAVVSRGGRPDLAGDVLPLVQAPTLLIVGSRDKEVLALNRAAQQRLRCTSRLEVVRGATHLFEEPGTLQAAAELARDWFLTHLSAARHR
jgi:putative phosphoribosyl transferase